MELLAEFDEVSDYGFCDAQIDAIVVDRQTGRFASLVELAKLFLKGRTPDCVGLGETYSLVFDMNVVFERLVGNMLRRHACPLGHVTTLQFAGKSLFRTQNGPRFCLKPDIGLSRGGNLVCLFDTKWKRLDAAKPNNNVSQADMYQMYAYGKEYKSSTVFLIYPYSGPLSLPTEYCCNDHTSTVKIRQIDLSQPLFGRRGSVCEQLRGLATEI
jgi:5-methylcytosine-specific restriction enzyme subunit McrC